MTDALLSGLRIAVTRERPGELAERLAAHGAEVVHVPLIEARDPADGGDALRRAMARLATYDWLVVTSPNGARRVVGRSADTAGASLAAATSPAVACVGAATAAVVRAGGREPDLVPRVASLDGLIAEFPRGKGRVLAARGELADQRLPGDLAALGWHVDDVIAYRTLARQPDDGQRRLLLAVDVVVVASGSAVQALAGAAAAAGTAVSALDVISIGPSTTAVASELGMRVAATAAEQSVDGIVAAVLARAAARR